MLGFVVTIGLLAVIGLTAGKFTAECLYCMCQTYEPGGCKAGIGKCTWDGTPNCGPFRITESYWNDCGRPGGDFQTCTKEFVCSGNCVIAYMDRYAARCTGGRTPTCEDYARVHNGGPNGCRISSTLSYWRKVQGCCGLYGGCGFESGYQLNHQPQNNYKDNHVFDQILEN